MQKVLAIALLAISFATLCNARVAWQAKGGAYKGTKFIPTQQEGAEHQPIDVIDVTDTDDRVKDPDWVPQPSDYIDEEGNYVDYLHEEDDYDDKTKDPDWVPQPSDYIEEEDNYVDYVYPDEKEIESHEKDYNEEEDELWSSDDDPDYVPDLDEDSQVIQDGDDHDDDPDFVPDYDGDYGDDDDDDDDPDFVPDYDADYGDDDDVDDDSKEGEDDYNLVDDYDYDRDEMLLNELLFEIALLAAEREDSLIGEEDPVQAYYEYLKKENFTYEEAEGFLNLVKETIKNEGGSAPVEGEQDTPSGEGEASQSQDIQAVKSTSKGKRQTKSLGGYGQQQSGQIQYSVGNPDHFVGVGQHQNQGGSGGITYHSDRDHADVAEGVEPLGAGTGGGRYDVATGVDAVDAAEDDSSFGDWFREGWGHVVNAADVVGDHVEDTFSDLGDKISGAVDTVHDAAAVAVDKVQDFASTAGETIVAAYHKVKGKLPELRQRIQRLFSKFGIMVRRGADYCIQQMQVSVDKVRQAEILDKLQQKLAEGNEEVTAFFTLLGEKITTWAAHSHQHEDIDTGLITIVTSQEGAAAGEQNLPEGGGGSYGGDHGFPNLFQDQEVVVQLNQMVNSGVITQEDLEQLSQQQTMRQVEYVQTIPQQEASGTIQVLTHKRAVRSHLRARRAHKAHRAH